MSRLRLLLTALAAVTALVVVAGCGSSSSNSSTSGGAEQEESAGGGSASTSSEGGGTKEGIKVAVLSSGTANDGSWGQAINEGAEEGAENTGADVRFVGNLEEPSQYQEQGLSLAQDGYELIVIASGVVGPVAEELAKKFPETKFGQIGLTFEPELENAATATPALPVATFQAGVLAGLMTKTDTVGAIAGLEVPTVTSEIEGFALGARWANPKVKILRTYIDTWTDAGKAKAAAQAQASQGADIIFSATDQATQGIYQLAESGDTLKYVIPQYLDKSDQAPNVILTSVIYGLQDEVSSFIEMAANEEWSSANVITGIEEGVGLAPNPAMESVIPKSATAKLEEVEKDIAAEKLKIPSIEELGSSESAEGIDLKSLES